MTPRSAATNDWGYGTNKRVALNYPNAVRGIHVSAGADPPVLSPPLTEAETAYRASVVRGQAAEGGYMHLHDTEPQTLALSLADSPVDLASWIVEKFHGWSGHDLGLPETFHYGMLLDTLMIRWATQSIGSSIRQHHKVKGDHLCLRFQCRGAEQRHQEPNFPRFALPAYPDSLSSNSCCVPPDGRSSD